MDLKLCYCVVFSLILLQVAYGTEARKMVQGNSEDNHQQALKEIYVSGYPFPSNQYNQGAEDNHQQSGFKKPWKLYNQGDEESHQQEISGFRKPWKLYNQGDEESHHQEISGFRKPWKLYNQGDEESHQQQISGFRKPWKLYNQGDEQIHQQEISGFKKPWKLYNQGDEESHQQEISGFRKPWKLYNQGAEDKDEQVKKENKHIHSSLYFLMDDLKIGKTLTLSFQRRRNLITSPSNSLQYFFPKEVVDSIPFSLKELPNLLQRFSLSKNSPQAKSMEDTLRGCEDSPIKGETKYCATSAEAMLDFVQGFMGEKTQIKALSTTMVHDVSEDSTPYTILDAPQQVSAPKFVSCHVMPFAYTVFYCHHTISKVKVLKVSLGNEASGDRLVEAIVVCHMDTSEWNPSHESFRMLGILPGSPVCHFFTSSNDLMWLPKPIATGHEVL